MSAVHKVTVTGYDAALLRLVDLASNDNVKAVAIAGGGTGYTVGDVLTVSGGTVVNSLTATLEVTSVASGVIDGVRVLDCGAYSAQPTNAVSVTGGTGSSATFNLTFETQNWTIERNIATGNSTALGGQTLGREVHFNGPGSAGADSIFFSVLCINNATRGSFNWALQGQTGFDSGVTDWEDQAGASYAAGKRCFVPLTNSTVECWFYVSPRSIKCVFRIGSTYTNMYAGFLSTFATPAEYPYPLYVSGCTSRFNALPGDSGLAISGLSEPGAWTGTDGNTEGPAAIRFFDGAWYTVKNWTFTGSSRAQDYDRGVYPANTLESTSTTYWPDEFNRFIPNPAQTRWNQLIPASGSPGSADHILQPSPNSDLTVLFPTHVWSRLPSYQILGELADVFWGSTAVNNIVSQDRVIIDGIYYRAFQNGNRTDEFAFFFMREDA